MKICDRCERRYGIATTSYVRKDDLFTDEPKFHDPFVKADLCNECREEGEALLKDFIATKVDLKEPKGDTVT
jgi:hypothetical protein